MALTMASSPSAAVAQISTPALRLDEVGEAYADNGVIVGNKYAGGWHSWGEMEG